MNELRKVAGLAALVGVVAGAASGAGAALLLRPEPAPPPEPGPFEVKVDRQIATDRLKVVENAGERLVIAEGRNAGASFLHPKGAGGILNLYAEDGGLRVQLGSYSQGGEKGQPLVALSDNHAKLRLLLRLAGKNESPVLVFKDDRGRDRMVIGLGLNDADQEPFIATFDKGGKKHMVTGRY